MKSSCLLEQKGHRALHFIGLPGSIAAETKGETEHAGELFELGQLQFGRNRPFHSKAKEKIVGIINHLGTTQLTIMRYS